MLTQNLVDILYLTWKIQYILLLLLPFIGFQSKNYRNIMDIDCYDRFFTDKNIDHRLLINFSCITTHELLTILYCYPNLFDNSIPEDMPMHKYFSSKFGIDYEQLVENDIPNFNIEDSFALTLSLLMESHDATILHFSGDDMCYYIDYYEELDREDSNVHLISISLVQLRELLHQLSLEGNNDFLNSFFDSTGFNYSGEELDLRLGHVNYYDIINDITVKDLIYLIKLYNNNLIAETPDQEQALYRLDVTKNTVINDIAELYKDILINGTKDLQHFSF